MNFIIVENLHITVRDIAMWMKLLHSIIKNHIKSLGLNTKLDIWVLHDLKDMQLTQSMRI